MNKSDIGMVKISLGDQNNSIQIMRNGGLEILREVMNRFIKKDPPGPDLSVIGVLYSIKDELIDINVSSLSMME